MRQTPPERNFDGSGNTFSTLASLWPYIWPHGRSDLKARVITALVLLVVAKILTVLVPYAYKWAVDALENGAGFAAGLPDWLKVVAVPAFLVIALGLDPAKGDPTGTWSLGPKDFAENGKMLGALQLPTLVVQEGGYRTRTLGKNAKKFFRGLMEGIHAE